MKRFLRRAMKDIQGNRFLTAVTVITIAVSILIASAFALFFVNAGDVLNMWQKGIRMMVYLKPDISETARLDTKSRLQGIAGVQEAVFIPKQEALARLKEQMQHHSALLENLRENPLPDAYELTLNPEAHNSAELASLADHIGALPTVAEVEYGRQWIQRFTSVVQLFSLAGYGIGALFFMATVFVVANTIRLVLYSRRDEIEIMRLVGATDRFIKMPFYFEGMLQGAVGTVLGLGILFAGYLFLIGHFEPDVAGAVIFLRFFPLPACLAMVMAGAIIGWLGCWISLKQFLK